MHGDVMLMHCPKGCRPLVKPFYNNLRAPFLPTMIQARSAIRSGLSHEERTATEPRDKDLHTVILNSIESVNEKIRLFQLVIKDRRSGIPVSTFYQPVGDECFVCRNIPATK